MQYRYSYSITYLFTYILFNITAGSSSNMMWRKKEDDIHGMVVESRYDNL
jgi:hypothetical protein